MRNLIYFLLSGTFGKKKYFRFYEVLRNLSMRGLNYRNVDIAENGELSLMHALSKRFAGSSPVLFDIGANNGSYSKKLNDTFNGKCSIFAFEPYSKAFAELNQNVQGNSSIRIFKLGFGNKKEQAEFYSDPVYSELGGLYKRDFSKLDIHLDDKETVDLDTLDAFCSNNNISRINFLKIDVEGFELNILKGAQELLLQDKVDIIQFEYGAGNYLSKTYLYDFFELLSPRYRICKLMKDGLYELKAYHSDHEIHTLCYYVAVNRKFDFNY
jgi:FkbM family methyltransferase